MGPRRSLPGRVAPWVAGLLSVLLAAALGVGCALSAPPHEGPRTKHFDGERFTNLRPVERSGFWAFVKWRLSREPGPWEARSSPPGPPPPARIDGGRMRVTFINHATTLVQMDGVNVLTDPIWSERASPFSWVGPSRHRAPGLTLTALPKIDAIVVSHNHYDHLDLATLRTLAARDRPRIFVGLGVGRLLAKEKIATEVHELDWWQAAPLAPGVEVIGVPAQHFSGRGLFDRDRTLWLGFVLRGPAGVAFFAGDTGAGPHFAQIRARFGPPRLAVVPIGAYEPRWFMSGVHVSPDQAVEAHRQLGATTSVGVHFGTFALADEGQDAPSSALEAALAGGPQPRSRFWVLGFGEGRDVP